MTYLEKYKMDHPGLSDDAYRSFVIGNCPINLDGRMIYCPADLCGPICTMSNQERCPICWNREIPGTENNEREDKNMNKNFTKADLKVGYVVKLKASTLPHMVAMNRVGVMGFVDKNGSWERLDPYDEFLVDKHPDMGGDWSVMEVYGYSKYIHDAFKFTTDNRELLWKREEEKPAKKMTVSEIEKALGYKVEVIAEEK